MKRYLIYLGIIIFTSCNSVAQTLVKYDTYSNNQSIKVKMKIPSEFDLKRYEVTVEKENQYFYMDSSIIYISNFTNNPNYSNIKQLGDSIANYRFQDEELTKSINEQMNKEVVKPLPDSLVLFGIDENNLFWKDIKIGKISIGYLKVSEDKKELFDKSLKTVKIKQP
ncbi:MAG TPA: hypothetical protein DCG75_04560 [Bacteroidales bacterium]|nr:hypothetical protein [Bacteroidales bacterium]